MDSNGKMETRHPVEGLFGSEFPAICNHCVELYGGLKSQDVEILLEFFTFFFKRAFTVQFSKFYSKRFHHDTDRCGCVQILWNVADGKSVKSSVI